MIIAFKTNNAKYIALNFVFLLLSPTAFAQNAPGTTSAPNGEIFVIRPAQNSQLNPGELEVIYSGAAPIVFNPGGLQVISGGTGPLVFNPGGREVISDGATANALAQGVTGPILVELSGGGYTFVGGAGSTFVGSAGSTNVFNFGGLEVISGGATANALAEGVTFPILGALSGGVYTVGGGAGSIDLTSYILEINYNNAMLAATIACSSGTQATCDGALRTLVAATLARYDGSTLVVLQDNVLLTLRQVVALVREVSGPAGSRAINIATIDTAFARAFPESTRTRPSSPS